jgi:FkbM family methyltransferase
VTKEEWVIERRSRNLRTRLSSSVLRTLLDSPIAGLAERGLVRLGHKWPYTLIARGTIVAELLPHKAGTELIADLSDGAKLSVPVWKEGVSLYLVGCLMGERPTTSFFRRALRRGDVFVDVGANLGFYTFMAAMLCGPDGEVHGFEPQPTLVGHLRRSAELNGVDDRVTIVSAVVGEREGSDAVLFLSDDPTNNTGAASVFHHEWLDANAKLEVPSISLDAYVKLKRLRRIDVMKIDVEGGEMTVLRGMKQTLETEAPRLIVLELFPPVQPVQDPVKSRAHESAAKPQELIQFLSGYGYEVHRIDDDGSLITGFPEDALRNLASTPNVVFAQPAVRDLRPELFLAH